MEKAKFNMNNEVILNLIYEIEDFYKLYDKEEFLNIYLKYDTHDDYIEAMGNQIINNTEELIELFENHLKNIENGENDDLIFRCLNVLTDLKKIENGKRN